MINLHFLTNASCSLQFKHSVTKQERWLSERLVSWVTVPSISHLRNKQTQQAALTERGSEHNAGTTRDQHFTSVSLNLELGKLCLHHLRQMPHGINTGTLADCQMSHTNKPEVGLLNRVKESKGETYMYRFTLICVVYNPFFGRTLNF